MGMENTGSFRVGSSMHGGLESSLPNYRLGKTLRMGFFGKVKVAEHAATGYKVAVRILSKQRIRAMAMEEKVRREIKIWRLLTHPHIIRLYEVVETPTDIYLLMEFANSGELFDHIIEQGRLSEDEARRFFQQIISGVEYCHRNMVVHRDLKPENILLDSEYNVKITDFGFSSVMQDGHFLKTSCGSPNYAAPEVISGKLYAGREVDVWSCGVILYALLCGSLPFDDENIPNLFKKIKRGIYTLPSHLSGGARDLISRILLVDPLKRVTIAEIKQHPWFQYRLPRYLAVPPPDTAQQAKRVDEDIVKEVVRLGFEKNELLESLQNRVQNQATVTYYLILDNWHCVSNRSLGADLTETGVDRAQFRLETQANSPTLRLHDDGGSMPRIQTKRKWALGLQLRAHPREIMAKVLKALQELAVRWKKIGHYNMKCRWLSLLPSTRHEYFVSMQDSFCARDGMDHGTGDERGAVKFVIQASANLVASFDRFYVLCAMKDGFVGTVAYVCLIVKRISRAASTMAQSCVRGFKGCSFFL